MKGPEAHRFLYSSASSVPPRADPGILFEKATKMPHSPRGRGVGVREPMSNQERTRCPWAEGELYVQYHDTEWGVPVHDTRLLFEVLILEGAQAGLSWETILKKRQNYRDAFENFDPAIVAIYGEKKRSSLLANAGIIRNRLKIESAVQNAKAFLAVQDEIGSLLKDILGFL